MINEIKELKTELNLSLKRNELYAVGLFAITEKLGDCKLSKQLITTINTLLDELDQLDILAATTTKGSK